MAVRHAEEHFESGPRVITLVHEGDIAPLCTRNPQRRRRVADKPGHGDAAATEEAMSWPKHVNMTQEMRNRGFSTWQFLPLKDLRGAAVGDPQKEAFVESVSLIDQNRTDHPEMNKRGVVEPFDLPKHDVQGFLWYLNLSQKHLAGKDLREAEFPEVPTAPRPWYIRLVHGFAGFFRSTPAVQR